MALYGTDRQAEAELALFYGNLRLVMSIVTKVMRRYNVEQRVDLRGPLFDKGATVFYRCLSKYDPTKKTKEGTRNHISTFATSWIEHAVARELVHELRLIKTPPHQTPYTVASLDEPVGEDESSLYEVLPAEDAPEVADGDVTEVLRKLAEFLPRREVRTMELRFGLLRGRPHTLEETGIQFDRTRELIRQLEEDALQRLKQNPEIIAWLQGRI